MRSITNIKPISYLKANAAEVLTHIAKLGEPLIITVNGKAKAVLQDLPSYEKTQETLSLLKILAIGHKEVAAGLTTSVAKAVDRLRRKHVKT